MFVGIVWATAIPDNSACMNSRHCLDWSGGNPITEAQGLAEFSRSARAGFTLIELLVVIAIIAILAAMLLPVLSKAKMKGQGALCMNNTKQLMIAWRMYTEDNHDNLPGADGAGFGPEWDGGGFMDFAANNPINYDPNVTIKKSPIWAYCGNSTAIWKCPADRSTVVVGATRQPRVRSVSMNCWMGGESPNNVNNASPGSWTVFKKLSQITQPTKMMAILDENEDSINNGWFGINMQGYPNTPSSATIFDYPAYYHNRAAGLAFSDGHSEIHKWLDSRTMPPVRDMTLVTTTVAPSPNNPDVFWLQDHATLAK
jgi:prepilin-type N-terminal cleavage/methylation domain-containing protein